jgi:hypothetical protein
MNGKEIINEMRKSDKTRDILYCEIIDEMTSSELASFLSMISHYIEGRIWEHPY